MSTWKLRPTVHYAPVTQGVLFSAWSDSFIVNGPPSLFRLVEVIVPLLDEGVTEEGLTGVLPEGPPRNVARQLLRELGSRGMLLDLDALGLQAVPDDEAVAFSDTIAHLEGMSGDPYVAFRGFRDARVLFIGEGAGLQRAATALARMGLRDAVVVDGELPAGELWGDVDLAVHVEEVPDRARFLGAVVAATRSGTPIVQGVATDTAGVVCGPSVGADDVSMVDVLDRIELRQRAGLLAPVLAGSPPPLLGALIGNVAAHRSFQWLAGIGPVDRQRVVIADPDTLHLTSHPVVPVRVATPSSDDFEPAVEDFSVDDHLARAHDLADGALGVFGPVEVVGLPQSPVFITAIRTGGESPVFAFGLTEAESRFRAFTDAIRATVPSRAGHHVGVGVSHDVMVLDGIGHSFLHRWLGAGRPVAPGGATRFAELDDQVSRMCWKSIAMRFGRSVTLDVARAVPGADLWLAAVVEGETVLSAAYGGSRVRAVRDALVVALGLVQTGRGRDTDAGWVHQGPALAGWPLGPEVHGLIDADETPKPSELLDGIETALAGCHRICVRPLSHPLMARAGVLAGWVGVFDGV